MAPRESVDDKPADDRDLKRVRHNFTVEVQSAMAGRDFVSSRIVHVQTGDEATWAGWDGQRVVAFIEDRARVRSASPPVEPGRASKPKLPLHTFGIVAATGPKVAVGRPITATVSFDAVALALPADSMAQAKVDIYARRLPPAASILLGTAQAEFGSGEHQVIIQVQCQLPPAGQPQGLFAVVQLFAVNEAGRTPSGVLPDARMTVS